MSHRSHHNALLNGTHCGGIFEITLLQIYYWIRKWNSLEHRTILKKLQQQKGVQTKLFLSAGAAEPIGNNFIRTQRMTNDDAWSGVKYNEGTLLWFFLN